MLRPSLSPSTPIEKELQQERGSALGRMGGIIERLLARLTELESLHRAAPHHERFRIEQEHRAVREEAQKYVWYLIVQREALHLYRHDDVHALYPVPPKLCS